MLRLITDPITVPVWIPTVHGDRRGDEYGLKSSEYASRLVEVEGLLTDPKLDIHEAKLD